MDKQNTSYVDALRYGIQRRKENYNPSYQFNQLKDSILEEDNIGTRILGIIFLLIFPLTYLTICIITAYQIRNLKALIISLEKD
jgi:hypothetical protein